MKQYLLLPLVIALIGCVGIHKMTINEALNETKTIINLLNNDDKKGFVKYLKKETELPYKKVDLDIQFKKISKLSKEIGSINVDSVKIDEFGSEVEGIKTAESMGFSYFFGLQRDHKIIFSYDEVDGFWRLNSIVVFESSGIGFPPTSSSSVTSDERE